MTEPRFSAPTRPGSRLLATLDTECASVDQLGQAVTEAFTQHPDHQIITSSTGLGDLTGARVLAEIGDDRTCFADACALKAYAGSAPVTRASGRSLSVTHRRVKNTRLAATGFIWAFAAAAHAPGASALYYRHREHGDRHAVALRNVFNRLIGCLYRCLQTGQAYDETKAFSTQAAAPEPAAA
jgi:transposase